jgi:XTP/dITP diphosphohydrolase
LVEEILKQQIQLKGFCFKGKLCNRKYGYDCFADDTGLEVEALNGAPGVFSGYAGERSAADNMDKLLQVLSNQSNRNAQFKTVVTLNLNGKHLFTGIAARLPYQSRKRRFRLRSYLST